MNTIKANSLGNRDYEVYKQNIRFCDEMLYEIENKIDFSSQEAKEAAHSMFWWHKRHLQDKAAKNGIPVQLALFN